MNLPFNRAVSFSCFPVFPTSLSQSPPNLGRAKQQLVLVLILPTPFFGGILKLLGHGPGQPALIDSTWAGGLDQMNSSGLLQLHLLCDSVNFRAWVTWWNINVIKTMQLLHTKKPMWRKHASKMMSLPLGQTDPANYDQLCDNTKNQPWGATGLLCTSCVISISQRVFYLLS